MKKLKIKKRLTSFLMLVVMVISFIGIIPTAKVYAGTFLSLETTKLDDEGKPIVYKDFTEHDVYQFQAPGHSDVYMICVYSPYKSGSRLIYIFLSEDKDFTSVKVNRASDNGDIANYTLTEHGTVSNNVKSYNYVYSEFKGGHYDFKFNANTKITTAQEIDSHGPEQSKYVKYYVDNFVNYGDEWATIDGNPELVPNGSENNPYEDKDIGTIILKSHAFIPVKNNSAYPLLPQTDDSTFAYYRFKYKDKTSSGFSISNNKYARTFIQVRVQNQCVLLDPNDRNVVKEFYKHYGEFYQYKNIPTENINDNIFKVSWDDIVLKWSDADEHPLSTNKKLEYRFMIRVICTDSLTVIPDEKSGWHAGGWRSIVFDGSNFVEETNGHITNDGKWTDDKDDGHNNSSDKTTDVPKTEDEANDSMNDNSSNSSTDFVDKLKQAKNAFDTANEYIKQVLKVPTMLGKLFSFFPDWVLYPFEFAFALIPWIIIYKLLRG